MYYKHEMEFNHELGKRNNNFRKGNAYSVLHLQHTNFVDFFALYREYENGYCTFS
jgi:hypothetical protein